MQIEQVLPHVLDCIDTARLGPRKVAMLELVYVRQAGQRCSVHLGPAELARYGRSRHQVGYDRRALEELVRLGMLRKIPGRGRIANGYALREPKLWDSKRIHWLGQRETIVRFFWLLQQRDAILLLRDAPGQSLFWCATGRLKKEVLLRDVSVEHRATTEFHRAASSALPVRIEGDHRAASWDLTPPAHTLPIGSSEEERIMKTSSSSQEEDGGAQREVRKLGRLVAKRIGCKSLYGAGLTPIAEAVEKFGDHLDQLYTLGETFSTRTLDPAVAAQEFLDAAEDLAQHGWTRSLEHSPGSQPYGFVGPDDDDGGAEMDPEARARMLESIHQLGQNLRIASSR